MRFHIRHETTFKFEPAARFVNGLARLTPRNHEGQFIAKWRLALDTDGRLKPTDDGFGNIVHGIALAGPLSTLTLHIEGEVATFDTVGVLRGTLERFPPEFFLRSTALTVANAKLQAYCAQAIERAADPLGRLHNLLTALNRDLAWEGEPAGDPAAASAGAVFAKGAGDAAGLTHAFIACAHQLAIPARFAYGWCFSDEADHSGLRSWAEAYVPGLGWVGFDPVSGHCPNETHVRVAIGLDALGAFPIRIAAAGVEHTNRIDTTRLGQT